MTPAPHTAQAVADIVGGRLLGDGAQLLERIGPLDAASPETLSFLVSPKYLEDFRRSRAGAVLLRDADAAEPLGPPTRIVVADPARAMRTAMLAMYPSPRPSPGVHATVGLGKGCVLGAQVEVGPNAVLGNEVRLGDRVVIGAGVVLGDGVEIGEGSVLGPRVVCYAGTWIGRRVVIKAGAVIGGTGFGYISGREGHARIPHVGGCRIEDDVDIGANSCVDRGSVGDTVIGRGTKIDNLVHVAHNVHVGEHCLFMAGVGVAGSTRIGNGVILAGQAGAVNGVTIGEGARVGAQSGVLKSIPPGSEVSGFPARSHREFLRAQAALYRLAPIARALEAMVTKSNSDG